MRVPDSTERRGRLETLSRRLKHAGGRLAASRRRHEVVEVVGNAKSDEDATEAVAEVLDVDTEVAREVVDMPMKAFTQERVSALEEETTRLEQRLSALREES